jgi:hypothetical protein
MDITEVRKRNATKQKSFRRKEKERKERAKRTEAFLIENYPQIWQELQEHLRTNLPPKTTTIPATQTPETSPNNTPSTNLPLTLDPSLNEIMIDTFLIPDPSLDLPDLGDVSLDLQIL